MQHVATTSFRARVPLNMVAKHLLRLCEFPISVCIVLYILNNVCLSYTTLQQPRFLQWSCPEYGVLTSYDLMHSLLLSVLFSLSSTTYPSPIHTTTTLLPSEVLSLLSMASELLVRPCKLPFFHCIVSCLLNNVYLSYTTLQQHHFLLH